MTIAASAAVAVGVLATAPNAGAADSVNAANGVTGSPGTAGSAADSGAASSPAAASAGPSSSGPGKASGSAIAVSSGLPATFALGQIGTGTFVAVVQKASNQILYTIPSGYLNDLANAGYLSHTGYDLRT